MMKTKVFLLLISLTLLAVVVLPSRLLTAAPADPVAGSTIEQRIELRKKERKTKLDAKQLARLKGRCVDSQAVLREVQTKLGETISKRQALYKKVDAKLWIVIGELKLADKDTFKLEQQRAEFAKKVAANDNTFNQYKLTLDDIIVMNCEADLNGFIAMVETAREYHALLRTQSTEIKSHIVDTVKKTLSDFATDLQPKAATENE